jgi:hypothetical protein
MLLPRPSLNVRLSSPPNGPKPLIATIARFERCVGALKGEDSVFAEDTQNVSQGFFWPATSLKYSLSVLYVLSRTGRIRQNYSDSPSSLLRGAPLLGFFAARAWLSTL